MLTLPSLLLAMVVVAILGPGLINAMFAVAIVTLPAYVRITRAAVIAERARDYVVAARVAGAGRLWLMFSTVLPNCMAPLIVQATLGFSAAILDAASARSRRCRNGAQCSRIRANSCSAPGGW
jgi:dipeptide transport system permease protein